MYKFLLYSILMVLPYWLNSDVMAVPFAPKYLIDLPAFHGKVWNYSDRELKDIALEFKWDCRKKTYFAHDERCGDKKILLPTANSGHFYFKGFKRDLRFLSHPRPRPERRYYGTLRMISKQVQEME